MTKRTAKRIWLVIGAVVVVVVVATATAAPGKSAHIEGKVLSVKALDRSTVRVFTRWTNTGKASGDGGSCIYNTKVTNQFGDQVNIEVNTTGTNGTLKPGTSKLLYQDLGVNAGDAPYVTAKDVSIVDC